MTKHVAGCSITAIGLLAMALLSGCANVTQAAATTSDPPLSAPSTSAASDPDIAATCSALSVIETAINGAGVGRGNTLTDAQYEAVISLIPYQVKAITQIPSAGLRPEVNDLLAAATVNPPKVGAPQFDPHSPAYRAAMTKLAAACKANGTEIFAMATTSDQS